MTTAAVSAFSPSRRQSLASFLLSFLPLLLYACFGGAWALLPGLAVSVWAGWALVLGLLYPHAHRGKRWALGGLAVAGAVTYAAVGDVAQDYLWRRAFQLTSETAVFQDPVRKWSVSYPAQWGRQEHRVGGTVTHVFRPSRATPAMQFSVMHRPDVGTEDLSLIVEGFFMNLPKGKETEVLERESVGLPSGHLGYRVVYTDLSRRIPLKNEILFVLDGKSLYFLSVQATPRWFDRHRPALERLLYSLTFPPPAP
jgi:hypothetical protein